MDDTDVREVIRLLRGLLKATDNGELDASTPNARALLRKLEGAVIALEMTVDAESEV
jgi:transcription elongation GreA/GreB family factor